MNMASEDGTNEIRNDEPDMRSNKVFWKDLTVRYWYFILLFGLIFIGAIAGFLLTLEWYLDFSGTGTNLLGDFSMKSGIIWILMLFVWELLIVALPTLVVGGSIVAILWFIVFPDDLKEELKSRTKNVEKKAERWEKRHEHGKKKHHRSSQSGGAFGFLVFIGFLIYIAVDGNWNTSFATAGMDVAYFVSRWITVFWIALLIFGIPGITFGLLWYWKKFGKE